MSNSGKAPTMIVWVISLVLFIVALVAHFSLAKIPEPVATWSWIVGFGLLLAACRIRGLSSFFAQDCGSTTIPTSQ